MLYYSLLFAMSMLLACNTDASSDEPQTNQSDLPLEKINLPPGFKISVYAEDVPNARSLELSPSGTLFVGSRNKGNVYAIRDEDGDHKADKIYTIASDMFMPNGVAFRNGSLYVAEVNRILRYDNIEENLENPPVPVVVNDSYPDDTHHGWKFIAFGPDDKLYVPVGAPCNICKSENPIFASITRINPDGSNREIVHEGIRNTVGFTWHPETNELWFTDNGRDWMGDNQPYCELNHAPRENLHFGYPYCHQGNLPDPKFGNQRDCDEFVDPAQNLGPHVAPLGLEFIYDNPQFPERYEGDILIAEHGSWNRSTPIGYRISWVPLDENHESEGYEIFAEGWLQGSEAWGRPVDLEYLPDGSLLVSDDFAGVVYRIYYEE